MSLFKLPKSSEGSTATSQPDLILALDIGSSFVKSAFGRISLKRSHKSDSTKSLQLLGFSKVVQRPGNISGGLIADIPGTIASCEDAVSALESSTGEKANSCIVGISGELVKSRISTIRYRRDNPNRPLSGAELSELLSKIESRSKAKIREEVSLETNNPDVELTLVNSAVVSISIDGYHINNPVGFKGSEIVIEYYTAFAPTVSVSAVEKICVELNLSLIAVVAEPFAVCRACLGDDVDADFSAILVDVGGGTTDVAVVDCGEICGTKTFNIGGLHFTRQISEALRIKPALAEKYKLNLEDESLLTDNIINSVTGALSRSLPVWLSGLSIALEEFNNLDVLPNDIFLCGGSASLLPLEELLATSDWYQSLAFSKRPTIHILDPLSLPDFVFPESSEDPSALDASCVSTLGLLRVGVDTILTSPEKESLKEKISHLLSH